MQMPVINAMTTPNAYPESSRRSECQVLSNSSARSLTMLCKTPAGLGKYGSGNQRKPDVMTSHKHNNKTAAARMGHICVIQRRRPSQNDCTAAVAKNEP